MVAVANAAVVAVANAAPVSSPTATESASAPDPAHFAKKSHHPPSKSTGHCTFSPFYFIFLS